MLFPPFGRGGGAFQWWGGAPGWQTGAGFMMNFHLNAVTNLVLRLGPVAQRWELSLARAVFLHRLGEIRDRKPENQSYRASGLTLLTATISLWNTVYMGSAWKTESMVTPVFATPILTTSWLA
ncbi:TPA: Tn3 family transposase [Escherichia coli]